jgi:hypothetical protein
MSQKPKWQIVFTALSKGIPVQLPKTPYPYALDTEGRLCWVYGKPGEGLVCDVSLNQFIVECERLTPEEITQLVFQIVVSNKGNHERRK